MGIEFTVALKKFGVIKDSINIAKNSNHNFLTIHFIYIFSIPVFFIDLLIYI